MSLIDGYIRGWRQSLPVESHGTLVERRIFSRVEPASPKPGALMQTVKSFSRAVLEGCVATNPAVHESEQEVLYVANGEGRVESEGVVEGLSEGSAVLIPPRVPHVVVNESNDPLEFLILTEEVPPEAMDKAKGEILVRNYHRIPVWGVSHWCYIVRWLFGKDDGLATLNGGVLHVSIDGMNIGEPHPHGPGTDEVWYQLKGNSLLFLGQELRRQSPGVAFMVPPDGKTPHASINPTAETMQWFYFAHF